MPPKAAPTVAPTAAPTADDKMEWRQSYAHLGSEYNIFRLMMKKSGMRLSKIDLARTWAKVKEGRYADGKPGLPFSQVIAEAQKDTKSPGVLLYNNKNDLAQGLLQRSQFATLQKDLEREWKSTGN